MSRHHSEDREIKDVFDSAIAGFEFDDTDEPMLSSSSDEAEEEQEHINNNIIEDDVRARGHSRTPSDMSMMEENVFDRMNAMTSRLDSMMNNMFTNVLAPFPTVSNRRAPLNSGFSFPSPFPDFESLASNPNCHTYSSRQVMSMAMGPDGRQQVYQASTSTNALPGGIRETKKTVCDSRSGVKKMSVEHHIGQRGHVIERQKNLYSGEVQEHQEFINLGEDDAPDFDKEFDQRIMNGNQALPAVRRVGNKPKGNTSLTPELLPITAPPSSSAESKRHTSRKSTGKGSKGNMKGGLRKLRK